jgi:hypothetical protein
VVVIDSAVSYVQLGMGVASPQPQLPSDPVSLTRTRTAGSPALVTCPPATAKLLMLGSATGMASTPAIVSPSSLLITGVYQEY